MATPPRPAQPYEPPVDNVERFASIYDETAARVHGVVLRVVRDPVVAEEVTQEVYLEVWRQVARYDPARGSAIAWLMTIAHGMAVDRVHRLDASLRHNLVDCAQNCRSWTHDETGEAAESLPNARVMRAALAALSVQHRQAIELAYFCGHPDAEVARLLGTGASTAQGWIRDGLIQLRRSIVTLEAEPGVTTDRRR